MKKNFKYYKLRYKIHKELHNHYEDLYKVALKELQFQNLQKASYKNILDEVKSLINKGVKKELINKVIELGEQRTTLDISIHYELITLINKE